MNITVLRQTPLARSFISVSRRTFGQRFNRSGCDLICFQTLNDCKHIWLHLGFCPTRLLSGYRWIIHWKNRKPTPLNAFIPAIITILNVFLAQILLQKKSAAYLLLTMRGLPWAMTDQCYQQSMLSLHWDKHLKPNWWSCTNDTTTEYFIKRSIEKVEQRPYLNSQLHSLASDPDNVIEIMTQQSFSNRPDMDLWTRQE